MEILFSLTLAHLFLILDILLAIFTVCSLVGNGFILAVIVTRSSLRRNESIYLFAALSLADFLLAFTVLPFITLLIAYWDEDLNYPAGKTLIFALPIVAEIKINSVLTVAIAVDRFIAIEWPIYYKLRNKGRYVVVNFLLGVLWAFFDAFFLFSTTTIKSMPGCAAAGCFMSETFRYYWGASNMFINLVAMAATLLVLNKIRWLQNAQQDITQVPTLRTTFREIVGFSSDSKFTTQNAGSRRIDSDLNRIKHANRVAVSVLLCSGICILLPSVFAGLGEMLGLRAFQYAGPFVAVGLVLCGFINTFIYAHKHRDIRHAIRVLTSAKNVTLSHTESNIASSLPPVRAFNESVTKQLRKDRDDVDRRVAQIHRFSNIDSFSDCDEIFV